MGRYPLPFDRTYEGLKPSSFGAGTCGSSGPFDRTYEGLKQGILSFYESFKKTFDRTYEGLKLGLLQAAGVQGSYF